jgi:hypothetical protein
MRPLLTRISRKGALGLLMLGMSCLTACHKTGGAALDSIVWDGEVLNPAREILNPSVSQVSAEGFPDLDLSPQRFLALNPSTASGQGSLKLLEFAEEVDAYAAFQRFASPAELVDGFAVRGDTLFLRKGPWLGEWVGTPSGSEDAAASVQSKLQLPGPENWGALPEAFSSLLHQGRIYHSERILISRFLGVAIPVPVFTARFDCHGDSAWIYSSPGMPQSVAFIAGEREGYTLDSVKSEKIILSRPGGKMPPLRLDFFEGGMVGVEGCFDDSLTTRWIEIQKKALKSLKLSH